MQLMTEELGVEVHNRLIHLGPARVISVAHDRVQVVVQDHCPWARLALGYPYHPRRDDMVLVISQDNQWYVIGVLSGTGDTVLSVPADLKLMAPRGSIELVAAQGIRLRSHAMSISSKSLNVVVQNIHEKYEQATRWVKGVFHLRAGGVRTKVDGEYQIRAESISQRAEHNIKLDGRKIHLG